MAGVSLGVLPRPRARCRKPKVSQRGFLCADGGGGVGTRRKTCSVDATVVLKTVILKRNTHESQALLPKEDCSVRWSGTLLQDKATSSGKQSSHPCGGDKTMPTAGGASVRLRCAGTSISWIPSRAILIQVGILLWIKRSQIPHPVTKLVKDSSKTVTSLSLLPVCHSQLQQLGGKGGLDLKPGEWGHVDTRTLWKPRICRQATAPSPSARPAPGTLQTVYPENDHCP